MIRVVFLCTESVQVQSHGHLFCIVMCNTELNSFVFNGMYKFSGMKII